MPDTQSTQEKPHEFLFPCADDPDQYLAATEYGPTSCRRTLEFWEELSRRAKGAFDFTVCASEEEAIRQRVEYEAAVEYQRSQRKTEAYVMEFAKAIKTSIQNHENRGDRVKKDFEAGSRQGLMELTYKLCLLFSDRSPELSRIGFDGRMRRDFIIASGFEKELKEGAFGSAREKE